MKLKSVCKKSQQSLKILFLYANLTRSLSLYECVCGDVSEALTWFQFWERWRLFLQSGFMLFLPHGFHPWVIQTEISVTIFSCFFIGWFTTVVLTVNRYVKKNDICFFKYFNVTLFRSVKGNVNDWRWIFYVSGHCFVMCMYKSFESRPWCFYLLHGLWDGSINQQ